MPKVNREVVPRKTIRIPKSIMDEVDEIVRGSELYINRQQLIESAIRDKIREVRSVTDREGVKSGSERGGSVPTGEVCDDLSADVKDVFLAHAIVNTIREKEPPADHLDAQKLEQNIRLYVRKIAERRGRQITEKDLDELTEEMMKYHEEILAGLTILSPQ